MLRNTDFDIERTVDDYLESADFAIDSSLELESGKPKYDLI